MHESHLTRRQFIEAAAIAVGGIGAAQALAGCGAIGGFPGAQGVVDSTPHEGHAADTGNATASEDSDAKATGTPAVFFTHDINSEAIQAVYAAMGSSLSGNRIGVKLSSGEPGSNFLATDLIAGLVNSVNGTIVECNTAYNGQRSETQNHYKVAADHGFTAIADFQIMDENGSTSLPVAGGEHLTQNLVGAHFPEYDGFLVLSHFKGHAMAGFGGALKNISIGMASREGKCLIHTDGKDRNSPWGGDTSAFQECMAEAAKSVVDAVNGNMLFVNVMNKLSVDCDCDGHPAAPKMADIGILASSDPVALDQACVDLVYDADDNNGDLIERIESRGGEHVLEHAEKIGLGSRAYRLIEIA